MDQVLSEILGPGGALVLALFILFGGYKEWWVYGKEFRRCKADAEEWKQIALRGTQIAERVVKTAERRDNAQDIS